MNGVPSDETRSPDEVLPGVGQRIIRNGSMNLGGHVLFAIVQLVVVFLLARQLGIAGLGNYYTLITLMLVVQLIVESGTGTLLTMRIAQSADRACQQIAEASGIFTIISVVSVLITLLLGGGWFLTRGATHWYPAVIATAIACGAIQWQRFSAGVFQASEIFSYENVAKVAQAVIFLGGIIILTIADEVSLNSVIVTLAISHVVAATFLMRRLSRHLGGIGWEINFRTVIQWMRHALPLGGGDVLRKITWQLDTIALAIFASPAQVGSFSLAYRPLGPLNWVPRAILSAAFPAVTRQAKTDPEFLRHAFSTGTRLLVVAGIPIAIGVFFAAEPLLNLLVGNEFGESVHLLQILIWVIVLSFVSQQFRYLLTVVHLHHYFAALVAVALSVKVAMLVLLTPTYGAFGACLGTLFAETLFTVMGIAVCARAGIAQIDFTLYGRILLSAVLMGAAGWIGKDFHLFLMIPWLAMTTTIYLFLCYRLGVFQSGECEQGKLVFDRIRQRSKPLSSALFGSRMS